jgi:hypothetical protein
MDDDSLQKVVEEMWSRLSEDTNVTAHVFMPGWARRLTALRERLLGEVDGLSGFPLTEEAFRSIAGGQPE